MSPRRTDQVKELLVSEGNAPEWFRNVDALHPDATIKHKALAESYSPASLEHYLIDDQQACIANDEIDWWVRVSEFAPPYNSTDRELHRVKTFLCDYIDLKCLAGHG